MILDQIALKDKSGVIVLRIVPFSHLFKIINGCLQRLCWRIVLYVTFNCFVGKLGFTIAYIGTDRNICCYK